MAYNLLKLHAQTTPDPRLEHVEGMAVVICGDSTVVFDREADARFYVEAHREVPALLERVRELETQLYNSGYGEICEAKRFVIRATEERDLAKDAYLVSQKALEREVALRTATAQAARIGLQARAREGELLRRIATLEATLAAERNSRAK